MAAISRPTLYGLVIVVGAALWWLATDEPPKASPKRVGTSSGKKTTAKLLRGEDAWAEKDRSVHFDRPSLASRDVFHPLVVVERTAPVVEPVELTAIPSKLADGEANWVYTGMVEVDGVKLALLENASSKQSGFLKLGESWKKSRIAMIDLNSIILIGPKGEQETVYRFNPNATPKPKAPAEGGFRPYDLTATLSGPIGQELQIKRLPAEPMKAGPKVTSSATPRKTTASRSIPSNQ